MSIPSAGMKTGAATPDVPPRTIILLRGKAVCSNLPKGARPAGKAVPVEGFVTQGEVAA
jgi:hypothetical protein